jgi:hypothetical protein
MKPKMTIHKDGSATIFSSYNREFLDGLKEIIPYKEREWTGEEWLIHKNAVHLLDHFEDCFPDGEVDYV